VAARGIAGTPDHHGGIHVLCLPRHLRRGHECAVRLSREGCNHYEGFDRSDEDFGREIFKVEDPVVKDSAGPSSIGCGVLMVGRRSGSGLIGQESR
jgi:hypothetical protein